MEEELVYVIIRSDFEWQDIKIYTDKQQALQALENIYKSDYYIYGNRNYRIEVFAKNIFGAFIPTYRQME